MIELSVRELSESVEAFKTLLEIKMGGRPAYLLARIMREVEQEYSAFQQARNSLIMEYCVKDENGTPMRDEQGNSSIDKEHINDFNAKMNELLNTIITLNADPIPLRDIEQFDFVMAQMFRLVPFIKE